MQSWSNSEYCVGAGYWSFSCTAKAQNLSRNRTTFELCSQIIVVLLLLIYDPKKILVILFNCGPKTILAAPLSYHFIALLKIFIYLGEVCWACILISVSHAQKHKLILSHTFSLLLLATNKLSRTNRIYCSCPALKHFNSMLRGVNCYALIFPASKITSQLTSYINCHTVMFQNPNDTKSQIFPKTDLWSIQQGFSIIQKFLLRHTSKLWHKSCGGMQSAAVNSSYSYSWEGFKEKISFTRLVFTGCANYTLVFQRHILSQPQSPS